jgi:uncharacterized protein (DUF2062 family)
MFRRRVRPSAIKIAQLFLWPRTGWHRAGEYLWHRLHRLPGTPHSIAAGFACGAAMSVTPLFGIHIFLGSGLAWLIRGNVLASVFGTILGNPWTFPVIWLTTYYLGSILIGDGVPGGEVALNFTDMFTGLIRSMIEADGALFMSRVWPVWWPMIVGSIPCALLTGTIVYFVFYRLVEVYQRRRKARRMARHIKGADGEASVVCTSEVLKR